MTLSTLRCAITPIPTGHCLNGSGSQVCAAHRLNTLLSSRPRPHIQTRKTGEVQTARTVKKLPMCVDDRFWNNSIRCGSKGMSFPLVQSSLLPSHCSQSGVGCFEELAALTGRRALLAAGALPPFRPTRAIPVRDFPAGNDGVSSVRGGA